MPVSREEFAKTQRITVTLRPRNISGDKILSAQCSIRGIRGGRDNTIIEYVCFFDLRNFPEVIPNVFILYPPEEQIKHGNILYPV